MNVYVLIHTHVTVHMWRSENSSGSQFSSSSLWVSGIELVLLDSKCFSTLSHLIGPAVIFFFFFELLFEAT